MAGRSSAAPVEDEVPAVPLIAPGSLIYERRGRAVVCHPRELMTFPMVLTARRIYFGTERLITTLSLGRVDEARPKFSLNVLTSQINLSIASQRDQFAKSATHRLAGSAGIQAGRIPASSLKEMPMRSVIRYPTSARSRCSRAGSLGKPAARSPGLGPSTSSSKTSYMGRTR